MTNEQLQKILDDGEGLTVEFKECVNSLNNSVYETVCSFSNRYGGHLFLGVNDAGEVVGVNPNCVKDLKKNFVNMLNNPQKISPTLFLSLEEINFEGKIILYVYIPQRSQVEMCSGKIFDRIEDADIDITKSVDLSANLFNRKSSMFTERKIFPYVKESDLRLDLMPRIRNMALSHHPKHPWENMSDIEILKSAGLYEEEDKITGIKGFNLAAVLLLGKDEIIRSCAPAYVTDTILRKENLDRYDDRLMVSTNLIESHDLLMEFIAKHTLDRFFLIGDQRVSVRSWIARELVSNILIHREYASAFPAKIVIEKDKIYTENWNRALKFGKIDPKNFTPYPKNPIIARFFVNIGLSDQLGSGVRNLYKYTKIYSNAEPELVEDDIFRTVIPLNNSPIISTTSVGESMVEINNVGELITEAENEFLKKIKLYLGEHEQINTATASELADKSVTTVKRYLKKLCDLKFLSSEGKTKNKIYKLYNVK
jgi:ATP-dependent DNA helicase RecG